jgi:hypothetical protein
LRVTAKIRLDLTMRIGNSLMLTTTELLYLKVVEATTMGLASDYGSNTTAAELAVLTMVIVRTVRGSCMDEAEMTRDTASYAHYINEYCLIDKPSVAGKIVCFTAVYV